MKLNIVKGKWTNNILDLGCKKNCANPWGNESKIAFSLTKNEITKSINPTKKTVQKADRVI